MFKNTNVGQPYSSSLQSNKVGLSFNLLGFMEMKNNKIIAVGKNKIKNRKEKIKEDRKPWSLTKAF